MHTGDMPVDLSSSTPPYADLIASLEAGLQRINACVEAEMFVLTSQFNTPARLAGEVARNVAEAEELVTRMQRAVSHFHSTCEELVSIQVQVVEVTGLELDRLTPDIFPAHLAARFAELIEDKRHTRESIEAIEQAFEHVFARMQALVPRGHLMAHTPDCEDFPQDVLAQCQGIAEVYSGHLESLRNPANQVCCDRHQQELAQALQAIDAKVKDYGLALDELRAAWRAPADGEEDLLLVYEAVQGDLARDIHTCAWEFIDRYSGDEQSIEARLTEDELEV